MLKTKNRAVAVIMAFVMIISMLPALAFGSPYKDTARENDAASFTKSEAERFVLMNIPYADFYEAEGVSMKKIFRRLHISPAKSR